MNKLQTTLERIRKIIGGSRTYPADRYPPDSHGNEFVCYYTKAGNSEHSDLVLLNQKDECIICRDSVGVPNHEGVAETWVVLYCGHKFGSVCIQRWFQESLHRHDVTSWIAPTCPVCREIARHPDCGHLVYENPWLQQYQHTAQWISPTTVVYTGLLSRTSRRRRRPHRERAEGYYHERDLVMAFNVRADEVGFCSACSTREIVGREEPRKPV